MRRHIPTPDTHRPTHGRSCASFSGFRLGGFFLLAAILWLPASAPATEGGVGDAPRHTQLQGTELRIQWQAQVDEDGGRFVLYRGSSPRSLGVLAELRPSERGSYELLDPAVPPGPQVYELRYRDPEGREFVLATEVVEVSFFESVPLPATVAGGSALPATLPATPEATAPNLGRSGNAPEAPAAVQCFVEPPTPPPRLA